MKKFNYGLISWVLAWCVLSVVFFYSLKTARTPASSIYELTLPQGDAEAVSAAAQQWLSNLEAEFPCGYDVHLRGFQNPESDVWGWTTWDEAAEVYEIHFYTGAPLAMVEETLLHEYAHVLVWDAVKASSHGGIFWAAYGNLYRFAYDK